jgi:O-antigen/teichoic acid export membrane protein
VSVLKNASIVAVGHGASVIVQLISTVILARILTPEDYGVFTIAVGAASLFYALRVFGTGNYLIAEKTIGPDTVASVFTITFTLSVFFGGILAAASPFLAVYYGNPAVTPTLLIIAFGFLINPFATVSQVLLQREERIKVIVIINLMSAILGSISMIVLGYLGAGPIALALGALIATTSTAIALHIMRPTYLTYRLRFAEWGPVLKFGGWLTGVSISTQYSAQISGLVLAKTLGIAEAGLFDKGNTAAKLPHILFNSMILMVLFPAIARENRIGEDMAQSYLFRLVVLTSVMWPIFIFLAFHGEAVVLFVFGAQWGEAGIVASIMAMTWFFQAPALLGDQVLIARQRVRQLFFLRFALMWLRLIGLLLFSSYGLAAAALCMLVPGIVYLIVVQVLVTTELDFAIARLLSGLRPNFAMVMASVAAGYLSSRVLQPAWHVNLFTDLLMGGVLAFSAWWLAVEFTKHPILVIKRRALSKIKW